MKTQRSRGGLLGVASALILVALFAMALRFTHPQSPNPSIQSRTVQAGRPATQSAQIATAPTPQVVVGTAEFDGDPVSKRYSYRNDYDNPKDFSERLPLYVIDNDTGQEIRMGNPLGSAAYSGQDDEYMLWHFLCSRECGEVQQGLHAYTFATGEDHFISPRSSSGIHPQIFGEWIAFGHERPQAQMATLYAGNIQTHEVITLTETLWAPNASVNEYFGISSSLAAWYDPPDGIVVYDLQNHRELTRITNLFSAFGKQLSVVHGVSAGETIVAWGRSYGYDLVTQSYFPLGRVIPPDSDEPYVTMSRVHEENRVLSWSLTYEDGTQRHVRAPLLDATPSTEPCIDGQNLVQNGDFEDADAHDLWQQQDHIANLLINDAPTGLADGGAWAVRLGRFHNNKASIRQQLAIPSNVAGITLTFDVRAHSWDVWGRDQLQIDLIDPLTSRSILTTPVQWNNQELRINDWLPMQVAIENWPGIDTPIDLVFRVQTDWALPTDFTIDNIAFVTTCREE